MSRDIFDEAVSAHRWSCEEIEKFGAIGQAFVDDYQPEIFRELDVLHTEIVHGYEITKERLSFPVYGPLFTGLD